MGGGRAAGPQQLSLYPGCPCKSRRQIWGQGLVFSSVNRATPLRGGMSMTQEEALGSTQPHARVVQSAWAG